MLAQQKLINAFPLPFHHKQKNRMFQSRNKTIKENALSKGNINDMLTKQLSEIELDQPDFGQTKYGKSLAKKYRSSVDRYKGRKIPNLYGVIMPSGLGKTTLSKKYGFLDPDEILPDEDEQQLIEIRREMLGSDNPNWNYHNDLWYSKTYRLLSRIKFQKPIVILCHTEEYCLEIGAHPLCAISTLGDVGLRIENGRDTVDYRFGIMNRRIVLNYTIASKLHIINTLSEAEIVCVGYAMQRMEIPHPYQCQVFPIAPRGYKDAPDWILRGLYEGHELTELEDYHRSGCIPDCVVQYNLLRSYDLVSDFGMHDSAQQWLRVLHLIDKNVGVETAYTIPDSFPHRSRLEADRCGVALTAVIKRYNLEDNIEVKRILRSHVGSSHTLVTAIIIYYATTVRHMRHELYHAVMDSRILCVPEKMFVSVNKEAYTYVRVSKEFMAIKLSSLEQRQLMYIQTMVGRKMYKVDPTDEIQDRSKKRRPYVAYDGYGWSAHEYRNQFTSAVKWLYRGAGNVKLRGFDRLIEFWVKRSEYVAKGSTVLSEEFEKKYKITIMMNDIIREVEKRHNKKSLFEQDGILELVAKLIIDKWGTNRSKAVPKMNEIGAERVLFPGELIQYIVMACVYFSFAELFPIGSTNLFTISQEHIFKYDMRLRDTLEGLLGDGNWHKDRFFCFDFKNFNGQHSVEDMIEITNGLILHAPTHGDFLHLCVRWIEDSYANMKILDEFGGEHDALVGLFSGWMFTMLMNCMCNDVYHSIANMSSIKLFGRSCLVSREGFGDDAASRIKYMEQGALMYSILKRIGYEANSIKQLIGKTQEFLRVMYDDQGNLGTCICRLIATFVSGNLEHEPIGIKELVQSKYEVIELLYSRGMSEEDCDILWECCLAKWGRIRQGENWTRIDDTVLHGRLEDGGFGIPDKDGCLYHLNSHIPEPTIDVDVRVPGMLAAMDRVKEAASELRKLGLDYRPNLVDITRIAKDSYDTQQILDHMAADHIDQHMWIVKYDIREKIPVRRGLVDYGEALNLFIWLEREDKVLHKFAKWNQYKLYLGIDVVKLNSALGNYDFARANSFSPGTLHYPRVAEYLKTHFTEYIRAKLLRREIDVDLGIRMYANLCETWYMVMATK